jgi:hypothetical protein
LWPIYASWVWTISSTIHQNLKGSTEEFCGGPCIQWLIWLVEMPWCCSRTLASYHLFPNFKILISSVGIWQERRILLEFQFCIYMHKWMEEIIGIELYSLTF